MTSINLKSNTKKAAAKDSRALVSAATKTGLSRDEYYMYKKDLDSIETAMKALEELAENIAELTATFGKRVLMDPSAPLNAELTKILSAAVNGCSGVHDGLSKAPEVMRPFLAKYKPGFLKRLFG